jgi:hypothetical protein
MTEKSVEDEETQFLRKDYSSNQYDVDLLLAYKQMLTILNDDKIVERNPGCKKRMFDTIEMVIRDYCDHNNLNFDLHLKHNVAIVPPPDGYNYSLYLALVLLGFDKNRIKSMLDWQLQRYEGESMFPSMVESLTYRDVKGWSSFDNDHRLKLIMEWVESNRQFVRSGKAYYKDSEKESTPKIDWLDTEDFLIQISKELWGEGYIQFETAFTSMIKKQREIKWLKSRASLAYFIFKLEDAKKIKSQKRGHFKAAEKLFTCDLDLNDRVTKKTKSMPFRKLSSKITSAKANEYSKITTKIDALLNRVFTSEKS